MNKQEDHGTITPERVQQVLMAYGTKPQSWPEQERSQVEHFLANNPAVAPIYQAESQLDALLAQGANPKPSPALYASILAAVEPKQHRKTIDPVNLWPFGPFWRPVGVLACSALLGLVLGSQSVWSGHEKEEITPSQEEELVQLVYDGDWSVESAL